MLFIILAKDKAGSGPLRAKLRPHHLQYISDAGHRIKLAGPILDQESGDNAFSIGSMIVIDAASEGAARLFAQNDPYTTGGLFGSIEIMPFKAVAGALLPS